MLLEQIRLQKSYCSLMLCMQVHRSAFIHAEWTFIRVRSECIHTIRATMIYQRYMLYMWVASPLQSYEICIPYGPSRVIDCSCMQIHREKCYIHNWCTCSQTALQSQLMQYRSLFIQQLTHMLGTVSLVSVQNVYWLQQQLAW